MSLANQMLKISKLRLTCRLSCKIKLSGHGNLIKTMVHKFWAVYMEFFFIFRIS
jgi:hypothetical protein